MALSSFIAGIRGSISDAPRWSVGSDGWTTFTPSPDSRIIYVASSGSSANDGLSPSTPKQTLQQANALARPGFPDWILLNRGDTFTNGFTGTISDGFGGLTANSGCNLSGRSRNEPALLGAYGSLTLARPRIVPYSTYLAEALFNSIANAMANIAVQSIEFYNQYQDPNNASYAGVSFTGTTTSGSAVMAVSSTTGLVVGMTLAGPGVDTLKINSVDSPTQITMSAVTNYPATSCEFRARFSVVGSISFNGHVGFVYLEDVYMNNCGLSLSQSTARTDVEITISRCIATYACAPFGGGQGIFMADFGAMSPNKRVITHECFLLNNGWHPQIWGADSFGGRDHNAYCHDIHRTHKFVRSVTARAPVNGYMQRNGSEAYGNVYLANAYAGTWGTGIRPNPLNFHDNVILQGADQEQPYLVATAATGVGVTPATITFTGIPSDVNGNSPQKLAVYDLDNPGALTSPLIRSASSTTTTQMTLNGAIQAGTRGNGVQAGDRIVAYGPICAGFGVGAVDACVVASPPGAATNTVYSTGSTGPFYVVPEKPIPSWVTVGMRCQIDHNIGGAPTKKFSDTTTIASISSDRLSFTTSSGCLSGVQGGTAVDNPTASLTLGNTAEQATVIFFDPTNGYSAAQYPTSRWGPNNIVCNAEGHQGAQYAVQLSGECINCDATGNYFYKWNSTPANNISDTGYNNVTSPQALNSNTTVAAYDAATIEGYMASIGLTATKDAFYAGCLANRMGAWDSRFTALAVVNYIRGCFGVAALSAPNYPVELTT